MELIAGQGPSSGVPLPVRLFDGTRITTSFSQKAYEAMRDDEARVRSFEEAIRARVAGAPGHVTMLEIGTGPFALLALFAAYHGVRRVFAVEANPEAAARARECVRRSEFHDRIEVLEGLSTMVSLPEPVDVVVAEVIGSLASEEGIVETLRDARRFLREPDRPDSWIPLSAQTYCAPIFYQEHMSLGPGESDLPIRAYAIDPRVCFLAEPQLVEDFCFDQAETLPDEWHKELCFQLEGPVALSGFAFFMGAEFWGTERLLFEDSSTWQQVISLVGPTPVYIEAPGTRALWLRVRGQLKPLPARYAVAAVVGHAPLDERGMRL